MNGQPSTPSTPMNTATLTRKIDVDNRLSLSYYYRIADILLKQANVCRQQRNIVDLYVKLLRFSSLVSETIPFHRDFRTSHTRERTQYKKKLLAVLNELESLKPEVQRLVVRHNKASTEAQQNQSDEWETATFGPETSIAWPSTEGR